MEDEPINQNDLIGCDTIEHSPSIYLLFSSAGNKNKREDAGVAEGYRPFISVG